MKTAPAPDILLIVVHDLGTHLGCYGNATVASPRLDALADEGVRFTRNFSTAPYCSPARGSIITGRWPHANGLMGLVNLGWDLPDASVSDARRLAAAGYETFLFGLQHEVKQRARLGFDHDAEARQCRDVAPLVVDFLRDRGRGGRRRPFYARVGYHEVHRTPAGYDQYLPDAPDPATVRLPPWLPDSPGARQEIACLSAAVAHMDRCTGQVLDALEEAGLRETTLVVFTTDHGPAMPWAKGTCYDAGLNTALIMRHPAGFAGGRVCRELISSIDLLPTLLSAAGAAPPADIQGRSFLPLLRGQPHQPNQAIYAEKNSHESDIKRAVRTDRWKYVRNFSEGPALLIPLDVEVGHARKFMGDDHRRPRPPAELYDLAADPLERTNLAGQPAHAQVERLLAAQLDDWMRRTDDPLITRGSVPRPPEEAEIYRKTSLDRGIDPDRHHRAIEA